MRAKVIQRFATFSVAFLIPICVSGTEPGTFWSPGYDSCAVTKCLNPITASSSCDLTSNNCVCTTASFVTQVATCLGQQCPSIVESTYTTYRGACSSNGGYTIALGLSEFLSAGGALEGVLESTFWGGYPTCAIAPCLAPLTAASACELDSNSCVCTNSTLVSQLAECIGRSCASGTATSIYAQYSSTCRNNGGYAMALSSDQWASLAASDPDPTQTSSSQDRPFTTFKTTQATGLVTSYYTSETTSGTIISAYTSTKGREGSSSTPSSTGSSSHSGYTEDQKIALGVGIGLGLPTLIFTIAGLLWRRGRGRA